jgi:hypothetical protein
MKDGETFKHKGHKGNEGKPTNANQLPLYPLCSHLHCTERSAVQVLCLGSFCTIWKSQKDK